jgi:hypothetical protein
VDTANTAMFLVLEIEGAPYGTCPAHGASDSMLHRKFQFPSNIGLILLQQPFK